MTDIVERLRASNLIGMLCDEAAGEIEWLRDENERLRAQLSLCNGHDTIAQLQAHIDEQSSEIERLRAVLNKIMRNDPEGYEARRDCFNAHIKEDANGMYLQCHLCQWRINPSTDKWITEHAVRYVCSVADYAADIATAQRRIDLAQEAMTQAQDELKRAQQAFIDHCNELDLSLEITPKLYQDRPYKLED